MEGQNVIDDSEAVFNQGYNSCLKDVLKIVSKWDMEYYNRNIQEIEKLFSMTQNPCYKLAAVC